MSELEVPKGWELVTLGDLGEYKYGYSGKATTKKSGKPYLRITDINFDGSLKPERVFVDISNDDFEKYRLRNDDLVIARTGATVGKSFLFHGTGDFVFASYLIRYRFDKSKLFSRFLHYVLQSPSFWKFIGLSQSVGAQPNVNATKMSTFEFSLPPLPTQKKIVSKLDHIFEKLDEKKKEIILRIEKFDANKINENYKNHLLKLAFDGILTGEEFEIIDGVKVPKGWSISTIGETAIMKGNSSKLPSDDHEGTKIHFIKVSDMNLEHNSKYIYDTVLHIKTKNNKILEKCINPGSIIIPKRGGAILTNKKRITTELSLLDPNVMAIIPNATIISEFLYYYFLNTDLKQFVGGEVIPQLNKYDIDPLRILVPPLQTQKKIVKILDQQFADWEYHKQELENIQNQHDTIKKHLNHLSSSILNDAFSGKLVN